MVNFLTALSLLLCVAVVAMWLTDFGPVYVGDNPQYAFDTDDRGNLEVCQWGQWCVRVPYWLLATVALVGPAMRLGVLRRRPRQWLRTWPGRCASCGYDLRATPQRCPECGAVPATSPSSDRGK